MRKILKGAIVLLIVAAMFFSTTAVTAETSDTPLTNVGKQSSPQSSIQPSPPTTTRALLWDNGNPDFVNGLCCQRIGTVQLCDLADDFHLDKKCTIESVIWETVDDATYDWQGTDDLIVYEYGISGPGAEIVVLLEISNTREYLGEQFSRPWYRYTIDLKSQGAQFDLAAGDYYILLRPYTAGTVGQSYWLTSPAPPGSKSVCYFRSNYWGYPNWISILDAFGFVYDVNFKLYGTEKSSKVLNRPIINFLQQHPNMFLVLQKLIQNLGL